MAYVPILKAKQGELDALSKTPPEVRKGLTVLLEAPPIPLQYTSGAGGQEEPTPSKSIDDHVADVSSRIGQAWGTDQRIFLDGQNLEEEDQLESGAEPIGAILEKLRSEGVQVVPVTGIDRVGEYQEAVGSAMEIDGRGCCLRITEADLEGLVDLEPQVAAVLAFLSIQPEEVDFLLDFGPNVPPRAAIPYQVAALPFLDRWRTFTVASSSFPENLGGIKKNSVEEIERKEWEVFTFLKAQKRSLRRMPQFGDYAVNHPSLFEMDPRLIRMSPNIRYTGELIFAVAKGEAYRRKKENAKSIPPAKQYPMLAKLIMSHREWKGESFSWGDEFIAACAKGECVGNPTNWRAVGTSHHLAFVVHQLASLP